MAGSGDERRSMQKGKPARGRHIAMSKSDPIMNSVAPAVRIVSRDRQSTLSKSQKLFNNLIKKIDAERKRLVAWQTMIPLYQQKHASEFTPLTRTLNELRAEQVRLFDKAVAEKLFSKNDKAKLKDIICSTVVELIIENDDEDLKIIYNKHSGGDIDAEIEEEKSAMKAMMQEMLGVDLGDDDIDLRSPESMMANACEKMRQKQKEEEQDRQDNQKQNTKRKKSAKTLAREAKQEAEAQNISQSIREVYRKLASALHPDKEQDALERDRKTALMQRVNIAYNDKDLLKLLELQLEVEQIDQAEINNITEERLKYYNKILTEQSRELQMEVSAISSFFRIRFNIDPYVSLSPKTAIRSLEDNIILISSSLLLLMQKVVAQTYGGIDPNEYVEWFLPISKELLRVLKPTGTFILNIKEGWLRVSVIRMCSN